MSRYSTFSFLSLAVLSTLAVQATTDAEARADSIAIHVGGGAHFIGHGHRGIGHGHRGIGIVDAALSVLGGVGLEMSAGVYYSDAPPVIIREYVAPAPVYYETPPVYAPPASQYVGTVATQPALTPTASRRWGLGLYAGSVQVNREEVGTDIGVLGRYILSPGLSLEGEIAKTKTTKGGRAERRLGGSLIVNLSKRRKWSPLLLVGGGYAQSELADGKLAVGQSYGEVGAGLQLRLSETLQLIADVRAGVRSEGDTVQNIAMGGPSTTTMGQDTRYTRARIGAMILF